MGSSPDIREWAIGIGPSAVVVIEWAAGDVGQRIDGFLYAVKTGYW